MTEVVLSDSAQITAGILLIAAVTIETGGLYLVRLARGQAPATEFQKSFARAGHGHAGVLVILALICQLYIEATGYASGPVRFLAQTGVAIAAILMPAGFFFASLGKNVTQPNRLIVLVYIGAAFLAAGLLALGIGLLTDT